MFREEKNKYSKNKNTETNKTDNKAVNTDNKTLIKEFKKLLIDKGIKQQFVADSLEISKQSLNLKLNKKHISFDDMMELLHCIDYELQIDFMPVEQSEE